MSDKKKSNFTQPHPVAKEDVTNAADLPEEPLLDHLSQEDLEVQLNQTEEKLNEANARAEEYKNQALRSLADLENVRKRSEKDIANERKYALERMIVELLPVIDSLERGMEIAVSD